MRLFKTRSLASSAIKASHVRVDGEVVKPSFRLNIGSTVAVRHPGYTNEYVVKSCLRSVWERRSRARPIPTSRLRHRRSCLLRHLGAHEERGGLRRRSAGHSIAFAAASRKMAGGEQFLTIMKVEWNRLNLGGVARDVSAKAREAGEASDPSAPEPSA
ncbi:hypothetical protein DAD186_08380 [Dermabacter vaginalis]|uniref:RNA-binding S4 domain-containing protein n=1 Tax=Dermabacter vaginalis TaxID=1630135 RepID=A0A1B0ZHH6_9MICO|nr:hypothetical protein DAD186_08380 [Dermabacter vaginalis]